MQSLPGGNAQGTYEEANKDENKEKNRYPNILPCEFTFYSVAYRSHRGLFPACVRACVFGDYESLSQ